MELLLLIPAFLVFLYSLYKLSADDHVLIRKNISLEQMFDIAFTTLWISLVFSRIYYFLIDKKIQGNVFIEFFSTAGGLSLTGAVVSGIVVLYLIGRYKKVPLGRLFDFFTLSMLFALPAGFAGITLLHLKQPMTLLVFGVSALLYLIAAILFRKFLYPKLLNRTLKEGMMGIFFFWIYSIVSFVATIALFGKTSFPLVTFNNFIYLGLLLLGVVLFIKQERGKLRRRV